MIKDVYRDTSAEAPLGHFFLNLIARYGQTGNVANLSPQYPIEPIQAVLEKEH
jgi:hypothetical protein